MTQHLHIVCLDCPSPPDYGGAIDMFYRIKALYEAGVQIHLHYFSYNNRKPTDELSRYCTTLNAYPRTTGKKNFFSKLPYIVSSRINEELITALNQDEHPVLVEGVHCTGIIPRLNAGKKVVVRLHNDEHEYYSQLANSERNIINKLYYLRESRLLKIYQKSLPQQCSYACITQKDAVVFKQEYGLQHTFYLPPFTPFNKVTSEEGLGDYCLYHGNLSVAENENAALWLVKEVFSRIKSKLIIAGKAPSQRLIKTARMNEDIRVIANPDDKTMNELIQNAHINLLPSFSTTGIKLKLIHSLFAGRHCVVNKEMVEGTGLESAGHIGGNAEAFASIILQLKHQPFTIEEISLRQTLLQKFDNSRNTLELMKYLS